MDLVYAPEEINKMVGKVYLVKCDIDQQGNLEDHAEREWDSETAWDISEIFQPELKKTYHRKNRRCV